MSDAVIVIPARYEAQRFPGKILASETGKPLIQHVHEAASRARCADRIIVATDDQRIADAVATFGGEAVMTRADHPNGTSRIAEVAAALNTNIIVNVQGDEPELDPDSIDRAVDALRRHDDCVMATLAAPLHDEQDIANPNVVKVVMDQAGRALYFSRAPIPHVREKNEDSAATCKHVGLYVYRRPFLETYVNLAPTPLETAERLEQLRVLEHGYRIAVAETDNNAPGIDTPEQYQAFVERFRAEHTG